MKTAYEWSGVVLAGGRSRRMGFDKAAIVLPDGRTLLHRQVELLRSLGPRNVLVAQRPEQSRPLPPEAVRWCFDDGAAGPLGGLAAALRSVSEPLLLALAVDMPGVGTTFLSELLARSRPGIGIIPTAPAGPEPLAAIYPRDALQAVEAALTQKRLALRDLAGTGIREGWLREWPLPPSLHGAVANWNEPADIRQRRGS